MEHVRGVSGVKVEVLVKFVEGLVTGVSDGIVERLVTL